jgi:hypothetical protein
LQKLIYSLFFAFKFLYFLCSYIFRIIFGRTYYGTTVVICIGPLRKHVKSSMTPCMIMVRLSGNKLSQAWRRPQMLPIKMLPIKMFLTNSIELGG